MTFGSITDLLLILVGIGVTAACCRLCCCRPFATIRAAVYPRRKGLIR